MKLPLKLKEEKMYYSISKCYSYDCYLNLITGGRGIGKTTGALIHAIKNYNNRGSQFIYLRRYKPELKAFIKKDPISNIIDGVRYEGDGAGGYSIKVDDETIGHCIPLSCSVTYKSISLPKVDLIIFDEYTLLHNNVNRYLTNEVHTLLDFASTVFRTRPNNKILLLGNNLDLFNPYYTYFDIPNFEEVYVDRSRGIFVHHPKTNPKLLEVEQETPLYKLTKGTAYAEYHYENKLLSNVERIICGKPNNARIYCRMRVNTYTLNVYLYDILGETRMFVEYRDKVINDNITYIFMDNNKYNRYDIKLFSDRFKNYMYKMYFGNKVSYSNEKAADTFGTLISSLK